MTKAQDQKDEREAAQAAERERIERESAAEIERNNQQAMTDQKPAKAADPATGAAARLQAFEDEVFGKDCPRINGAVERGIGSPWAKMSDAQRAEYAALERLVAAEAALSAARAALLAAEAECVAVSKSADEAAVKADEARVAAKDKADAAAK